ncbi:MAG TPA: hypothetical protein VEM41_13330 [Actinomycetota bacterium]|nr:hypothetical protein [Actinomycetota bacterium]
MTSSTLHPLAEEYLARLRAAAGRLPPDRRDDLISEIEAHLAESLPPDATEAQVRTAIDRLGDPEQIVAAEAQDEPAAHPAQSTAGPFEWVAIGALLIGGLILPVVGWIVGVVMLWVSKAWTVRDKVIGTLVLPLGLAPAVVLSFFLLTLPARRCLSTSEGPIPGGGHVGTTNCTGGLNGWGTLFVIVVWVALLALPVWTALYLGRRAGRTTADSPETKTT